MADKLISATELKKQFADYVRTPPHFHYGDWQNMCIHGTEIDEVIALTPVVPAIPVTVISDYLQRKLDEWEALGDRKWEPANMWGYNFLRACQDDLDAYEGGARRWPMHG